MPARPIIEEQYSQPQAVIISHTSLLARELDNQLQQQQISTKTFFLPSAAGDSTKYPRFPQEKNLGSITQLKTTSIDYLFYLYPSLGAVNPSELERFFHSLPQHCKIVIIDNFRYQTRVEQLQPILRKKDCRTVYLGDPFGPFYPPQVTNPVLKAITQVLNHQHLEIQADGQNQLFPTYTPDIVAGTIKAVFNTNTQGQTFYLSTLEPISQIDFANHLKSHASDILNFTPTFEYEADLTTTFQTPDIDRIAATQAQLNWTPDSNLDHAISQTLSMIKEYFQPGINQVREEPAPPLQPTLPTVENRGPVLQPLDKPRLEIPAELKRPMRLHPNLHISPLILFVLAIIATIAIPPYMLYSAINRGANNLDQSFVELEQGRHQQAKILAQESLESFTTARSLLGLHRKFFFVFQDKFNQYDQLLDIGSRLDQVIVSGTDTVLKAEQLYSVIAGTSPSDLETANTALKTSLESLFRHLSLVQASIDKVEIDSSLGSINQLQSIKDKLPEMRNQVESGINLTSILPSLIGGTTPKTYLVLIQNNSELRPTGGFIPAVSLITFDGGRLTNIQTTDVYSLDSKLNGEVIPPEAISTHLGESSWYLRDSNWSPNFPSSALQAEWFLDKELGRSVDGVIGLNLFVLHQLLNATGPISVPGQNHPVSADNLFEIIEYGSQIDYSSTSPQKNELLVPIADGIFTRLLEDQTQTIALARAINSTLQTGQLTLYSNHPEAQEFIDSNDWSGTINNPTCPPHFNQENCTSETFALIEANVGVNRSNYFINRRIQHDLTVGDQGQINHLITVNYQNNAPNNSWPAGRYKTYTRLYAPLHSQPLKATLGDTSLEPVSVTPDLDLGLQEISYVYEIPAGSELTFTVSLRSSQIFNSLEPKSTLTVNWEKQSGTTPDPLSLNITYPSFLKPTQISRY